MRTDEACVYICYINKAQSNEDTKGHATLVELDWKREKNPSPNGLSAHIHSARALIPTIPPCALKPHFAVYQ